MVKKAKLTCTFSELYPIIKRYVCEKCFEKTIDIENEKVRQRIKDMNIQDAIVSLLTKVMGNVTVVKEPVKLQSSSILLSKTDPFVWRRKHLKCNKTVFNFVAIYNDFEARFGEFLDKSKDVVRFSALAESFTRFKIDYLSSKGAIRFYYPDFVAIQSSRSGNTNWIIETKGREYPDTDRKDAAMKKWREDISKETGENWGYMKVPQKVFDSKKFSDFEDLVKTINHNFGQSSITI